jgi:hypothetical protein
VSGTTATMTGNDQACLSRNAHGAFESSDQKVKVACASLLTACTITIAGGSATLSGNDARTLSQVIVTGGKAFRSRGQGGGVLIDCAADGSTCVVAFGATVAAATRPLINR